MTDNIYMTPRTKLAFQIAYAAHHGQVDKEGLPYILHPVMVAEEMDTEDEIIAALLHDVVEDTEETLEGLLEKGMPKASVEAVGKLTRDKSVEYLDYVKSLMDNPIAVKVKCADLRHNLREKRKVDGERAKVLHARYNKALEILENKE